jgi:hypothetical protein
LEKQTSHSQGSGGACGSLFLLLCLLGTTRDIYSNWNNFSVHRKSPSEMDKKWSVTKM